MKNAMKDSETKLTKQSFMQIMKTIFVVEPYNLDMVFELLFKRFKLVKCEIVSELVKNEMNKEKELYCISDIINEDKEIDVYEIALALSIFLKCDFKEKMHLIFDLTDVDEDGYINEKEIKNMIFVVNFIFCDEESPLQSSSSVINQSLSSLITQQVFNMIMKHVKMS